MISDLASSEVNSSLNIVFMGTPDFSIKPLEALVNSDHHIVAIFSQPPRRSGRGMKKIKHQYTALLIRNKFQSIRLKILKVLTTLILLKILIQTL
jgi:methionyl-tRNA formyltransferase